MHDVSSFSVLRRGGNVSWKTAYGSTGAKRTQRRRNQDVEAERAALRQKFRQAVFRSSYSEATYNDMADLLGVKQRIVTALMSDHMSFSLEQAQVVVAAVEQWPGKNPSVPLKARRTPAEVAVERKAERERQTVVKTFRKVIARTAYADASPAEIASKLCVQEPVIRAMLGLQGECTSIEAEIIQSLVERLPVVAT